MTTVNRPTDVKVKEADVNRKLQFYGIATAFRNGKMPSNEQIDIALNSFLASRPIKTPSTKLSKEGQALVAEFRDVVEQAKVLLTKNEGNLLQDFIWQSQHLDGANVALPGAPVDKETAKQHGSQALEGLRTLGILLITNGQFRKLLNDATVLFRDIAGDAASKAANKVNPNEDELRRIDEPAADNTWHDAPDMSSGNIKNQIKSTYNKQAPLKTGDLRAAAGDFSQTANPNDSRDPRDTANLAARDQQVGSRSGVDARAGLANAAATLRDRASDNTPEDTKNKGHEYRDRTKDYLSGKMPKERRDQAIWRLKKMVVECQSHPDYQQAINTLLSLAEEYAGHANNVTQQSTGTVKGAHADSSLQRAEADLKTLVERFANNTSTRDLFDSIDAIYRDADRDPELKNWFKQMDQYIRRCLKVQGYIMEDSSTDEWNQLHDRGNFLLRDRYRNHTDRVLDEIRFIADQFDKDAQNKRFAQSMQKLFNDLGNDENGKPTFKSHLIKDLTDVILPAIFEGVRYVPIPRIEYSDTTIDAVVENLVIESDNLMPNMFEVANDSYFRWGRKTVASKNHNSAMISVSGIQMDLKDVAFYVKKKQGFPSLTDQGVADIYLGGSGFCFKLKLSTAEKSDRQNFFKVEKVDVDVKNFNIKLKQSKHKLLFALVKPLMLKIIRPALQKVLEKVIKDRFNELDGILYGVRQEVDRAKEEVRDDPSQAPNIYRRYVDAAQKQFLQGKKKAENVAVDKKVNVAMTQADSIFPNVKLPGGISSKATEYRDLARKGDNWESSIFKLGSASSTRNLPKAGEISRKDHSVTDGGVRGPQNIGNTNSMAEQARDPSAQNVARSNNNGPNTGGFSNQVDQAFKGDTGVTNGKTNGQHTNGNTVVTNQPVSTGNY